MSALATSSRIAGSGYMGTSFAKRFPDHLIARQERIHKLDQPFKPGGVTFPPLLLADGFQAPLALINDHPHRFPAQSLERIQILGEQNCPEIRDVPTAGLIRHNQPIFRQTRQNLLPVGGQRLRQQIEIGRIIQQREHLRRVHPLHRLQFLERRRRENPPQLPLQIGIVFQLLTIRPDPDELDGGKLRRLARRARNLQQDDRLAFELELVEPEMQARIQQAEQPVLQILIALLGLSWFEHCACHLVRAILDAPNEVGVGLAVQGGGIAQRRDVFADVLRIGHVLFELQPAGFRRQLAQLVDQSYEVFL